MALNLNSIQFLIHTLINVYCFVLVLRIWFQFSRIDFYNPLSQTLAKLTNPLLLPLQKIIPSFKNINLAGITLLFILGVIKYPLINLMGDKIIVTYWNTYLLVGTLHFCRTIGETVLYVIFVGAIISWFNRGQSVLQFTLYHLTEPLLKPIRNILPNTGMIDFSPMILAFILFYLNRVCYDLFPVLWSLA